MSAPGRVLVALVVVAAAIGIPAPGRAAPTGSPAPATSATPSDPPADFNGDGYGDLAVGFRARTSARSPTRGR